MKLVKCLKHALNMVVHSKLRSWLTILGIVIGVAAVIAIVSIGEGMQSSMDERMGGLGADIITLSAGFSRGSSMFRGRFGGESSQASSEQPKLGRKDLLALKTIPEIALIDTNINGRVEVSYLGKTGTVSLTGVDQRVWSQITTTEIRDGRMLDTADQNVVVIGERLADGYFDKPLGINQMFTIGSNVFRVVGVLDGDGTGIYMPIAMAYQMLEDKENGVYDSVVIKVKNEDEIDLVIEKIENKLMLVRHVNEKEKDFSLSSSKQMMETRQEMMDTMSIFLTAIASVSLIVGAVGIANTMFTSVLEKTKEIGIMKAIGARNKDVLLIFLLNAGLIGLVGGILGVVLGIILSGLLPTILGAGMPMSRGGMSTLVSLKSIMMALSVSIIIGVLAGVIPAYKASKLKPVDALRYE